jgi:hypothetical protein
MSHCSTTGRKPHLHASIYLPVVLLLSTRRRSPSVQAEHMPASCCLSCNCSMGSTGPPSCLSASNLPQWGLPLCALRLPVSRDACVTTSGAFSVRARTLIFGEPDRESGIASIGSGKYGKLEGGGDGSLSAYCSGKIAASSIGNRIRPPGRWVNGH